ncbi:hypothetical protein [Rhodopseudomonas sp. AAP120]|uniref:hypothetical protein n=1 Tax=Rhodopseudomonas sp. AAP120 TaxID=1523430 RepID=UPI000B2965C2
MTGRWTRCCASRHSTSDVWLRFTDGCEGVRDLSDLLNADGPMLAPLRDPAFVARAFVEMGAHVPMAWRSPSSIRAVSTDPSYRLMAVQPNKWFEESDDHSDFVKALAEVRRLGTREGWCYHHVQAILLSIDQYAESALGNREYFWNKPHGIR